jgi:CubicO group peptidase (beta-lactamase class C family)
VRGNLNIAEYRGADGPALRLRAAQEELSLSPGYPPGTRYAYSNLGYIIVGAAVERLTGATWEEAIARELFEPLEMGSTGFRGTGTPGEIDQPWPHTSNGQPAPINGPDTDNPAVMSPAGGVNCTIQDWARFIRDQLRGARGEPALLNAGSYEVLHTPPFGGNYALGWIVAERGWAGGKAFNHGGDNTMNFANVWIAPARDFAILVCANQGGKTAFQATDAAVMGLSGTVARRQLSP